MAKGYKPCKTCGKDNALRASTCSCGAAFEMKSGRKPAPPIPSPRAREAVNPHTEDEHEVSTKLGMHHVLVPAGKCPFQFLTSEEIPSWIIKIRAFGAAKGQTYAPEVYTYWAGTFIDKFSVKGKALIDEIKKHVESA